MNSSVIVKKIKKEKIKCSYTDRNDDIQEGYAVHNTVEEKTETIFKSNSNISQKKKKVFWRVRSFTQENA